MPADRPQRRRVRDDFLTERDKQVFEADDGAAHLAPALRHTAAVAASREDLG